MKFVITIMGLLIAFYTGCNEETSLPSCCDIPVLPPMNDTIPYEALGEGKILLNRIGPIGNNYSGIYVIDIDRKTTSDIESGVYDGVTISPTGEKIAYSNLTPYSSTNQSYSDVYVMNINGTNAENISQIVGQESYPSWTPDGQKILFVSNEFEPEYKDVVYIQSPIPNPSDRNVIKTFTYAQGPRSRLSVSRNNQIVFMLLAKGIYVMNIDGSDVRELISGSEHYSPVWSPNGSQIAFLSVYRDSAGNYNSMDVMLMNSDGSNPVSLIQLSLQGQGEWVGQNNNTICWSPDGTKLLFNKHDGELVSHIYVINTDGTSLTQITFADGVTDRSLSWCN